MCYFQFSATHPQHVGEQQNWSKIWVYCHSYWLAIFCTFLKKKHNYWQTPCSYRENKMCKNFPKFCSMTQHSNVFVAFEIVTSLLPLMSVYQNFLTGRKVTLSCYFYNLKKNIFQVNFTLLLEYISDFFLGGGALTCFNGRSDR